MKLIVAFSLMVFCSTAGLAATKGAPRDLPRPTSDGRLIYGGSSDLAKTTVDTILLMGPHTSTAAYHGDFENGWSGWTSVDLSAPTEHHWSVSDYGQSVAGNLAAWCGDPAIPTCNDSLDVTGGYGNDWLDRLVWSAPVADAGLGATVRIQATLQYDSEPGYDYTELGWTGPDPTSPTVILSQDGQGTRLIDETLILTPADFAFGGRVEVFFRFSSDGGWSDEDCSWPTGGACQIDDITITVSQSGQSDLVDHTDFQDGTFGDWMPMAGQGAGDFAARRAGLKGLESCRGNTSSMVSFIDDGLVVPGTGGQACLNWCYGPGGYIVNTKGGLAGPQRFVHNAIVSPVMAWPDPDYDGALFQFDVYRHEDLDEDAPGMFFTWAVRGADTDGSAGEIQVLANEPWVDNNFVYYGAPKYTRESYQVGAMFPAGRDEVQFKLAVHELGWAWGWNGDDGYPAPWFDNVAVRVYRDTGPPMSSWPDDVAQDAFPERDLLDYGDLASLHVGFDSGTNASLWSWYWHPVPGVTPGDSINIEVGAIDGKGFLNPPPVLHYQIDPNPVFDPFRLHPLSGQSTGAIAWRGTDCWDCESFRFVLPDTGLLFPGDVMHYYITATDEDAASVSWTNTLPRDLSGYGDFSHPLAFDRSFTLRALPSIRPNGAGGYETPPTLIWDDSGLGGALDAWLQSLGALGLVAGQDYDLYCTRGPAAGGGGGLGGRTTGAALAGYDNILYTSGEQSEFTLTAGGFYPDDHSDDLATLQAWLGSGARNLMLCGDNFAWDLAERTEPAAAAFLADVVGVDVVADDVRPLIGNQSSPVVAALTGNPVFAEGTEFPVFGGACGTPRRFDAVTPRASALTVAEFTGPDSYPYAAALINEPDDDRVLMLPFALGQVHTPAGTGGATPSAARTELLRDVLAYFGAAAGGVPTPVPAQDVFTLGAAPNPFNPATRITYTVRGPGHLLLRVFDLRGRLVRTLVDEQVLVDGQVRWDGTDDAGQAVASGVYFSEARMGNEVRVNRMALVK